MRNRTASRWLAVLLTSALLVPLLGAPPALAASSFTGGALDSVLYVPNDHTPIALRYEATGGLSPNTQYYVKVRFTVGTSPNPSTNRGFTWNPTTQAWAPDLGGANWSDFPTVMSDASGLITAGWVWAKFGDENAAGAYHILISLSDGATTYNSTTAPATTVLDMSTNGAWVHNGTTIASNLAAKRAECTSETSSGVVYSLGKTELDTVDNDSDGVVDNEDYGPVGRTSDLRLGVPVGMNFVTYVNRTTTYASARQITIADTDIALNAADQTAPSAPGAFKVEPTVHGNDLSWTAASDTGGSGLAGYRVYRRVESETPAFSNPWSLVATPTASATSFSDTGIEPGIEYFYEVRAVDGDTNVGPRASDSGTPLVANALERTSGPDRYATAIAISENTFAASSVTTAVVATGKDFADALSASGLAGAYGSPILLVGDSVTASLTAELDRLGATDVVLIGGTSAISTAVETALDAHYTVDRVAGTDRYATAVAVGERIVDVTGGGTDAFFARGDSFADALAVSPFAYSQTMPVLLVRTGSVPAATASGIGALGIANGVVAGGTAAVSATAYATLDALLSGTITRVGGTDRYQTARLVADFGVDRGWGAYSYVGLATGLNYPDALGGSAATAVHGGVLLLTAPTALSAPVSAAITANKATIDTVELYGGPSALSQSVYDAVEALLQ